MLKIKYFDLVTNSKLKEIIGTEENWSKVLAKRKLNYAGHVMRGSSCWLVQLAVEGYIEGKQGRGRPRRMWSDNIREWTGCGTIGMAKRISEIRSVWRRLVHNLRLRRCDID